MRNLSTKRKIIFIIVIITILFFGIFLYRGKVGKEKVSLPDVWNQNNVTEDSIAAQVPQVLTSDNSNEFVHEKLKFSFRFPNQMKLTDFLNEEENEIVLVQDVNKGLGFQITISPFDESDTVLTKERVLQDIPELQMEDVQPLLLGDVGKGIAFKSNNENYNGESREVWFVLSGNLYQVSTYSHLDPLLQAVMNSWKFE